MRRIFLVEVEEGVESVMVGILVLKVCKNIGVQGSCGREVFVSPGERDDVESWGSGAVSF